jgi:transcriptional regulator with XRE-family HTH domain
MSAPGGRRVHLIARRKHLGFTQESLAHALEVSTSSVAQWERGAGTPTPRHRRRLADLLEVDLTGLDLLLDPGVGPVEAPSRPVVPWMAHGLSLEQVAAEVWWLAVLLVPGLLQVRSYAEGVIRAQHRPSTEEQIQTQVDIRLAGQNALFRVDDPLRLRVVLDGSILLRSVGGNRVMVEQLTHLLWAAEMPTIELRLLPLDGAAVSPVYGPFWLLTKPGDGVPFMVCMENATAVDYGAMRAMVDDHVRLFEHLERVALSTEETIDQLDQARRRYEGEQVGRNGSLDPFR